MYTPAKFETNLPYVSTKDLGLREKKKRKKKGERKESKQEV